jgi:hypothetical protein
MLGPLLAVELYNKAKIEKKTRKKEEIVDSDKKREIVDSEI